VLRMPCAMIIKPHATRAAASAFCTDAVCECVQQRRALYAYVEFVGKLGRMLRHQGQHADQLNQRVPDNRANDERAVPNHRHQQAHQVFCPVLHCDSNKPSGFCTVRAHMSVPRLEPIPFPPPVHTLPNGEQVCVRLYPCTRGSAALTGQYDSAGRR
jgi:hypothetical protein